MNVLVSQPLGYWHSGGALLLPLAVVSVAIWAYFLRSRRFFADVLRASEGLEAIVERETRARGAGRAAVSLARLGGLVAVYAATALADIAAGKEPSAAFDEREDRQLRLLRRDLIVMAALTTVAPLIGLLGTVTGMIHTFDAVAAASGETSNRIALGVSQALITTQFGLVVAIPGVFGMTRLQRLLGHVRGRLAAVRVHVLMALHERETELAS